MKKIIIAIHGLGNKPEATILQESWFQAIQEGLQRIGRHHRKIPFEMVCWADISYPEPLDPGIDDPENPLYLTEPYTASPDPAAPIKSNRFHLALLQFLERNLDRLFLKKNLKESFPGASTKMMEHYFSDLDRYYSQECTSLRNTDCSAKNDIQARLINVLRKYADYEILLISHSMGSIIAFDVLSQGDDNWSINTLVTMGSPLGLPPIVARNYQLQQSITPDLERPHVPHCIWPHWYNVSDRRDTVALDHTLRDDYAANSGRLKVTDLLVTNDYVVNDHPNPHKSFGYLRSPEVAQIIDSFLNKKRGSRFQKKCDLILGNIYSSARRLRKR